MLSADMLHGCTYGVDRQFVWDYESEALNDIGFDGLFNVVSFGHCILLIRMLLQVRANACCVRVCVCFAL